MASKGTFACGTFKAKTFASATLAGGGGGPAPVAGPYRVAAAGFFVGGPTAGQAYAGGSVAGQGYAGGSVAGQGGV